MEQPKQPEPVMSDEEMNAREEEAKKLLGDETPELSEAEKLNAINPADNIKFNLRDVAAGIQDPEIRQALEASIEHHTREAEATKGQREAEAAAFAEKRRMEKEDADRRLELQAKAAMASSRGGMYDTQMNISITPEQRAQLEAAKRAAEQPPQVPEQSSAQPQPPKKSFWRALFG